MEKVKNSGLPFEIVEYLKTPPSVEELDEICLGLDKEPLELVRTKEKLFRELGLSKKDKLARKEWLKIMSENPRLIERPIVVYKNRFALGRPMENVERLLEENT